MEGKKHGHKFTEMKDKIKLTCLQYLCSKEENTQL